MVCFCVLWYVQLLIITYALLQKQITTKIVISNTMFTIIVNITYSYFLYNISRPTRYGVPQLDLSLDEVNIEAPESLSHNQLLVERVICKTFTHHKCDVVITDCLRSYKLLRMGKTMHKLGGRGRANQIEKWKETNWSLVLQPNEIVPRSKKRKAEHVFVQDQVKKIAQLQDNLENYQQSLKAANIKLHKVEEKHKQLATSLISKVTKHHKSWSQYSAQYKRQQKKTDSKQCVHSTKIHRKHPFSAIRNTIAKY